MICPYCDGDGVRILEAGFYRSPCHYCNGQGEVWNDDDFDEYPQQYQQDSNGDMEQ